MIIIQIIHNNILLEFYSWLSATPDMLTADRMTRVFYNKL